jgi:hypothetical protein
MTVTSMRKALTADDADALLRKLFTRGDDGGRVFAQARLFILPMSAVLMKGEHVCCAVLVFSHVFFF